MSTDNLTPAADTATPAAAPKTVVYEVEVMFGDCDPAGIVFFPNFSKWMDASSLNFFVKCGVPPWRELIKTRGIVGTPLLEINTSSLSDWGMKGIATDGVPKKQASLSPTRRF